jgi:hypothetical protein
VIATPDIGTYPNGDFTVKNHLENIGLVLVGLVMIAAPIAFKAFIWAAVAKLVWHFL